MHADIDGDSKQDTLRIAHELHREGLPCGDLASGAAVRHADALDNCTALMVFCRRWVGDMAHACVRPVGFDDQVVPRRSKPNRS